MNHILFLFLLAIALLATMLGLYQRIKGHFSGARKPLIESFSPRGSSPQKKINQPIELAARTKAPPSSQRSSPTTLLGPVVPLYQPSSSLRSDARLSKPFSSSSGTCPTIIAPLFPDTCPACGAPIELDGKYCGSCGMCLQPDTCI